MSTLERAVNKALQNQSDETKNKKDSSHGSDKNVEKQEFVRTNIHKPTDKNISLMLDKDFLTKEQLEVSGIIHPRMNDGELLNAYRNLRTHLLDSSSKENFVTLITSVVPTVETAKIALNLAATFALDDGKTAVLIEGDIYSKNIDKFLCLDNAIGLIDYLESDSMDVDKTLLPSGIKRLRFVSGGQDSESAQEYFTSSRMRSFLTEVKDRYPDRYPIVNAACILKSADTRILMELVDKVVLVVPRGESTEEDVRAAAKLIGKKRFAGIVTTGF